SNGNNLLKAAIAEINVTNENITTTRYAYTGTGASFTAPLKGVYTLIGYGAQGGTVYGSSSREDDNAAPGGNGGYSVGNVSLGYNETIFVYVGGEGGPADASLSFEKRNRSYGGAGGWNGGGRGGNGVRNTAEEINYWYSGGGGGGGATHFSSLNKQIKDFGNSSDRELILIAGGGGGACWTCEPGNGGGLEGTNSGLGITGGGTKSLGGTQTFGYSRGVGQNGANGSYRADGSQSKAGSEGRGGGGGGYWGGCSANETGDNSNAAGGGGSGYIGPRIIPGTGSTTGGVQKGNGCAYVSYDNRWYIEYNGNGATSGSVSKTTMHVGKSGKIEKNSFSRPGYKFAGWNTKTDGTGAYYSENQNVETLVDTLGETITLYAIWMPNITYVVDGDKKVVTNVDTITKGGKFTIPAARTTVATRANCHRLDGSIGFDGWYTDSAYTKKWTNGTAVDAPLVLYARNWASVTYKTGPASSESVTYTAWDTPGDEAAKRGTGNIAEVTGTPARFEKPYNTTLTLAEPTYKRVTFDNGDAVPATLWAEEGWHADAACTGAAFKSYTVTQDATVYKKWISAVTDYVDSSRK
ncbi:MAG: InlB B-repeat-containing protein, partial [Eggerthellaceae bacterium]|nr:InlB B-repeat-containing protein [Eggerthellaceae bacterium]